jgi:hypothetical protein
MTDTLPGVAIRVSRLHCGPPGTVNGGWAAGLTAGLLTGPGTAAGTPVEVTLRAPMPIEATVTGRIEGERALITDAFGALLAEAAVVADVSPPPAFVAPDVAERAGRPGSAVKSPFPGCYVCGFEREGGLRVTIGRIDGSDTAFAGLWTPPDATGELPARYVWAALDCPSGLVHLEDGSLALLGRMTLAHYRALVPGEPHVVVAEPTGAERRKRFSVAALYTSAGDLVAHSAAVWITI